MVKDISIGDNKTERETNFIHDEQTIISNKKYTIPVQKKNHNNKYILTNKHYQTKKKLINILTNNNNTISNININSNSNKSKDETSKSFRSKIYQKKRIPVPQKVLFQRRKKMKQKIQ